MADLPLSAGGRRYGYLRKPHDALAFGLASIPNLKLAPLPSSDLHLEQFMQPVKDQGQLGSCTAFCGTGDREAIAAQYEKKIVTLAPLFLYYIERQLDGSLAQGDCGSTGQTSCQALNQFGICQESDDPYDPNNFQIAPNAAQLADAVTFKAGAYHSIFNVEDLKTCIISGYRVRIGMNVYDSFENDIGSDGLMPVPNLDTENMVGGHEVLIYGYDDMVQCPGASAGAFKVRNSWGKSWGLSGDFWLPQELAGPSSIIQPDFKIQHLGPAWK